MADDDRTNDAQAHQQLPQPSSDLNNFGETLWWACGKCSGR
jgi:hypothetical protein